MTSATMLQKYVSLKIHSPLKSVKFQNKLHLWLIVLQYDLILRSNFNQDDLITLPFTLL